MIHFRSFLFPHESNDCFFNRTNLIFHPDRWLRNIMTKEIILGFITYKYM
jgi:hypothetical protein